MSSVEERLRSQGLVLPQVPAPVASYVPAVRSGNLIFTAGQIPREAGELKSPGKVDEKVDRDAAKAAARQAALQCVAVVKDVVGDLDRISRIVKVAVFVNSSPEFSEQSYVADGASELLEEIFGEAGKHARAAIGVAALPLGSSVEIELTAEITPE